MADPRILTIGHAAEFPTGSPPKDARILCTKAKPWVPGNPQDRVEHDGAEEVGEQEDGWPGGDIVRYQCPNCGTTWREELAQ